MPSIIPTVTTAGARYSVMPGAIHPRRAHAGDAGMDLALQETTSLKPGETAYIPGGVAFHMPVGLCAHVMTRSSTFKRGVIVVPTIVDASYTDEASVIVTNISDDVVQLERGDSIAQVVILPYYTFDNEPAQSTSQRSREDKFGSSGKSL